MITSTNIRAFIAIELPGKIVSSIGKIQERMAVYGFRIRWIRPDNIHLTLKFLGDIETASINEIRRVMDESVRGQAPISLKAKGIGVFPGIKRPRVIWVGISGQLDLLVGLHKTLDEKLEAIGFPKENRPFRGHLTLGRVKAKIDPKKFGDTLNELGGFESESFVADRIILFKSELKPTGAVYTKLVEASLI